MRVVLAVVYAPHPTGTDRMMAGAIDPPVDSSAETFLAFLVRDRVVPAVEIRVNFGIFAGRTVTSAEIERLAQWLLDEVEAVTILSEERHEIGKAAEASTHQVAGSRSLKPACRRARSCVLELEGRLLERVDYWARTCIAERHAER